MINKYGYLRTLLNCSLILNTIIYPAKILKRSYLRICNVLFKDSNT